MFEAIEQAAPDPILGLTDAFKADTTEHKINLGVGIYQNSSSQTPVLPSVKNAEGIVLENEITKSYLPITGAPAYAAAVQALLFGADHPIIAEQRAVTAHTPGGTGALRVTGDFLKAHAGTGQVWLTTPTWPNHGPVFAAAGIGHQTYPWYSASSHSFDFDAAIAAIAQIPAGDSILLHGCCHNPTGCDPTLEQWKKIAAVVSQRGLLPIMDFAYQGFANDLETDALGLREILKVCPEVVVCSSFSKNFGLYRERAGAVTFVTDKAETTDRLASQLKSVIRSNYSNPPAHGGSIVATIFADASLTEQWKADLTDMRTRLNSMRALLVDKMTEVAPNHDFSFIRDQYGMFSMLGLNPGQVKELREKHAIYMAGSSRINIAGLTESNLDQFCKALAAVL